MLIVYLVTQNPEFKGNLAPLAEKLKESEDMLKFLGSLSSFPCSVNGKPDKPPSAAGAAGTTAACGSSPMDPPPSANSATHCENNCNDQAEPCKTNKKNSPCREGESPLRTVGGEWIDKYITKYLQK